MDKPKQPLPRLLCRLTHRVDHAIWEWPRKGDNQPYKVNTRHYCRRCGHWWGENIAEE